MDGKSLREGGLYLIMNELIRDPDGIAHHHLGCLPLVGWSLLLPLLPCIIAIWSRTLMIASAAPKIRCAPSIIALTVINARDSVVNPSYLVIDPSHFAFDSMRIAQPVAIRASTCVNLSSFLNASSISVLPRSFFRFFLDQINQLWYRISKGGSAYSLIAA